ncbi:helix-turn-helix transcriptional regulator [Streptomyces sp. CB03238]|uniref:helix-turn-helix domain-containing protein n=1 Tax=Streptomyces sp. CB03238 TaxID=1907777 RepID=UPI000A0FE35A|nr:helix-turn-helix transcriptional regulator [Streptomyces sp. CB03238]ORT61865.1 transcriptional regulator [Streptomyces sp. CB03238]
MANACSSRQAAWEFFGTELKNRREAANMTQQELGRRVFVSGGYIGQFEQAIRKPQLDVAARIDEVLQTGGIFERMCRTLINTSPYAEYFAAAAELEALAIKLCDFAPTLVPGLLQTAPYARAVTLAMNPFASEEDVEGKVAARMDRARILKKPISPVYWAILHENVLRTPVGGPATMAEQLDHIAVLARERTVLPLVIPYEAGAYALLTGMVTLMEFDDAPPTAYTEAVYAGNLLDDPALVKQVQAAYDLLRASALPPEPSLTLLESAAEDHRRCARTT